MKSFKLLFVLFVVLGGCDPIDDRLTIVNKTNRTIFFEITDEDTFDNYPVKIEKSDTLWDYISFVKANEAAKQPLMGKRRWERYVNQDCKDSTLRVFIFDKKLLHSVPPDSLVSNQLYSKKYSYKVKDLEKLNWRIEYK